MFYGSGMKEQQEKEWKIEDFDVDEFSDFLEYLYSGKIMINSKVKINLIYFLLFLNLLFSHLSIFNFYFHLHFKIF